MIIVYLLISIIIIYSLSVITSKRCDEHTVLISYIRGELSKFNRGYENIPIYISNESYTINKQKIYICIGNNLLPEELMYVILHEVAHVITPVDEHSEGHGPSFMRNFDNILNDASKLGIKTKQPNPQEYHSMC